MRCFQRRFSIIPTWSHETNYIHKVTFDYVDRFHNCAQILGNWVIRVRSRCCSCRLDVLRHSYVDVPDTCAWNTGCRNTKQATTQSQPLDELIVVFNTLDTDGQSIDTNVFTWSANVVCTMSTLTQVSTAIHCRVNLRILVVACPNPNGTWIDCWQILVNICLSVCSSNHGVGPGTIVERCCHPACIVVCCTLPWFVGHQFITLDGCQYSRHHLSHRNTYVEIPIELSKVTALFVYWHN